MGTSLPGSQGMMGELLGSLWVGNDELLATALHNLDLHIDHFVLAEIFAGEFATSIPLVLEVDEESVNWPGFTATMVASQ